MNREEKQIIIDGLAEKLNQYPHFYLVDISGLNAEQTAKLRHSCFESNVTMLVVKNTLLEKALVKVDKADVELISVLSGSTTMMFTDVSKAPAVLIKEFRKSSDKPIIKAAYVQESIYIGDASLEDLVNIKSKEELIGEVIGLLQSPAKSVISALQSNAGHKIAALVKALEEKN